MRKLTEGNKTKFAIFAIVIILTMSVLITFLIKALAFEKEIYNLSKENSIYDAKYEFINLKSDAKIEKKWDGKYYLTEVESNLSYNLGNNAIAFDNIKNRLSLYGTFYEIALDGEVTKKNKYTEISDIINSKIYKIEDRKYLLVSEEISNDSGSLTAENYLIIVIDKSGNTLLLNNTINVKTINALLLKTDSFIFDVANEKLLFDDIKIDLKKVIGSTNEYAQPIKQIEIEKEENKEDNREEKSDEQTNIIMAGNGNSATSYSSTTVNSSGPTTINVGNNKLQSAISIKENNFSTSTNNQNTNNNSMKKNSVSKSVNFKSITPNETSIDVEYSIVDQNNEYQVVYILIKGDGISNVISLDKSQNFYKITGLKQNTEYSLSLGYKLIKSDSTIEEIIEDVINLKTKKVEGRLIITKVTENEITFNLKIDQNSSYDNAQISIWVDGAKLDNETINVNIDKALQSDGWTSSIKIEEEMIGKLTLKLENVKELPLISSTQIVKTSN